jgi:hypothetical protein
MALYTITCHCGKTVTTPRRRQQTCSRRCAQHTPEARVRNYLAGVKGGRASGIVRQKHARTPEYRAGFNAGWSAGRRHGWAEALGEALPRKQALAQQRETWQIDRDAEGLPTRVRIGSGR